MNIILGILAYAATIVIAVTLVLQEQIKQRKNKRKSQDKINLK